MWYTGTQQSMCLCCCSDAASCRTTRILIVQDDEVIIMASDNIKESYPVHDIENDFIRMPGPGKEDGNKNVALILLNSPSLKFDIVKRVWPNAKVKYCADGAANRLHEFSMADETSDFTPDAIIGDLDSVSEQTMAYYRNRGAVIDQYSCQDTNDLDKCVTRLISNPIVNAEKRTSHNWTVVVLGAFGGRLDHEMASYHCAYKWQSTFHRFVLMSSSSWSEPLPRFKCCKLSVNTDLEGPHCGLVALKSPAEKVFSEGLQWNLSGETVTMGSFISTSNRFQDNTDQIIESKSVGGTLASRTSDKNHLITIQSSSGGELIWMCSLCI